MPNHSFSQAGAPIVEGRQAKPLPLRQQGKDTYEMILATAGNLLGEIGFERLTTNLVCERAGMTPPALYRYFPNKYALLAELARRLMDVQDQVFLKWVEAGGNRYGSIGEGVKKNKALRKDLIKVTREQPGGMWILRAIRAVPLLQEVRVESRNKVLEYQFEMLRARYPGVPENRLRTALRISEQMVYAAIEMILEDPDLDEDQLVEEISWMTCFYFCQLEMRV